ncbi:MAG: zinc-binding alcohol dehydrogenase family protein [Paraglaciecola sp.]|nr:zinc-binding alcohol dehydrogenase family protein [Paraglaciecola sp.]
MRAIGYQHTGSIDRPDALLDIELPYPIASGHDVLVEVKAVSVNPVDTKMRSRRPAKPGEYEVLGYDASGVVQAVGADVTRFKVGDAVYYAGSVVRPGSNAQLQLVDERIVSLKPQQLSFAQAAAVPLTALTAWEALFDNMQVEQGVKGGARAIVIIGGAGGVGSIAIQLARQLTDLIVIASASRAETQAWVKKMGAHHVIDHRQNMAAQIAALDIGEPAFVLVTTHSNQHAEDVASFIAPQGKLSIIEDLDNISHFKAKSVSIHWEFMFTRSMFATADMAMQGEILTNVAKLLDEGKLVTTLHTRLSPINAATLIQAHRQIESATTIGKVVIEDFS